MRLQMWLQLWPTDDVVVSLFTGVLADAPAAPPVAEPLTKPTSAATLTESPAPSRQYALHAGLARRQDEQGCGLGGCFCPLTEGAVGLREGGVF